MFKFGERDWLVQTARNLLLLAVFIAGFVLIIWITGVVMVATVGAKVVPVQNIMLTVTFTNAAWI